jgi:hypothetical protein
MKRPKTKKKKKIGAKKNEKIIWDTPYGTAEVKLQA